MKGTKNVDIGFNLYDLPGRPSSSPTDKPAGGKGHFASTKAATGTRLVATPPPRRSPAERTAGVRGRAPVLTQETSTPSTAAPSAALSSMGMAPGTDNQPSTRTDARGSSGPSGRGEVEASLQGLLATSEQLVDDDTQQLLVSTLRAVQQARRRGKGARPVQTGGSRRGSQTRPQACDRASVSDCLVRACAATSHERCVQILCEFYNASVAPLPMSTRPAFACLVAATMADLVLSRAAPMSRTAAGPSPVSAASPVTPAARLATALEALDFAVSRSHVGAMLRVGLCLRDGVAGLTPNLPAAVTWIERAASTGYPPAMHEMGVLYEHGLIIGEDVLDADWGAALLWYRKAAEKAHRPSQLDLGKLLLTAATEATASNHGDETERQALKQQAVEWLESAAASEDQEAIHLLQRLS